jgi:hypothetical protein
MPIRPWRLLSDLISLAADEEAAIRISVMWNRYVHLTRLEDDKGFIPEGGNRNVQV